MRFIWLSSRFVRLGQEDAGSGVSILPIGQKLWRLKEVRFGRWAKKVVNCLLEPVTPPVWILEWMLIFIDFTLMGLYGVFVSFLTKGSQV